MSVKHLSIFALASLVAGLALADDPPFRVVLPADTALRLVDSDVPAPNQGSIELEGRVSIRAKYYFLYEEDGLGKPILLLRPDQDSISRLPYLIHLRTGWAPERATEILVSNIDEAARALLPEELAAARSWAGERNELELSERSRLGLVARLRPAGISARATHIPCLACSDRPYSGHLGRLRRREPRSVAGPLPQRRIGGLRLRRRVGRVVHRRTRNCALAARQVCEVVGYRRHPPARSVRTSAHDRVWLRTLSIQ